MGSANGFSSKSNCCCMTSQARTSKAKRTSRWLSVVMRVISGATQTGVYWTCRLTMWDAAGNTTDVTTVEHIRRKKRPSLIFVCFLAYVLRKIQSQLCDKAEFGSEPRRVLAELSDIRSLDVVLPSGSSAEIRTRCISKPTDHQQIQMEKLRASSCLRK